VPAGDLGSTDEQAAGKNPKTDFSRAYSPPGITKKKGLVRHD
jgi:hypothetical protein